MPKKVKEPKVKRPTLLRKIIEIHHEEAMRKKALRILTKQEWSVEFFVYLCAKAAKLTGNPVEIVITSPSKQELKIRSTDGIDKDLYDEDNILNHLDDTAYVNKFFSGQ